jgi:hypothetical protein
MRRLVLALPLALVVAGWFPQHAHAQALKKSRGTLTNMAADSVTVKVGTTEVQFKVDEKTMVQAPGAGTKTRQAAAAGKSGAKLSDVLHVGDAVEVSYHDADKHAASIRKVSSPGSGGVPSKTASGTVTEISGTSMSINGSSGSGATFTQTFAIDAKTKVIGRGLGTAAQKSGGHAAVDTLIGKGDRVSVSFDDAGGSLRATEIRVTAKAAAK